MSKVIFKMSFKHPNLKTTSVKNIAHMMYIATRPGVDKSITEEDLRQEMSADDKYLKYIDERPLSHGLFDELGKADIDAVREEIKNCKSYVWRAIVSIREDDALKLGYLEKRKWQDLIRSKMYDVADIMGIKSTNLKWVAAVHMAEGHPHAHIMIWEKTPERTLGVVREKQLQELKKIFTDEIFKEERSLLLQEKNAMRDLIRDLAKNDMSKATLLLKEVRETGKEIRAIIKEANLVSLPPKLNEEIEIELINKVKNLAESMPGKGRINLKFMPENVKEEVRSIADFILNLDEYKPSVAKYLNAVENENRLYTGNEETIQETKLKTYNDIRDRISQLILRAAVESNRDNIFYVDRELSDSAINTIKSIISQIDVSQEKQAVLKQIITSLIKTDIEEEQILNKLSVYCIQEDIMFNKEEIAGLIKEVKEELLTDNDKFIPSVKMIDKNIFSLKIAGYNEIETYSLTRHFITNSCNSLLNELESLVDKDYLKHKGDQYVLTEKGVEEFLKEKTLDCTQKEILSAIESGQSNFTSLIENKVIFNGLIDKDPEEVKISKFDTKIRDEFGPENRITYKELEERLYQRYTTGSITDIEKVERELDILHKRIEKLTLNGYIVYDKESEVYSFSSEAKKFFIYDEEHERYQLTKEAKEKFDIPEYMEFSRYDAGVTLSYIDKADNGVLTTGFLKETLLNEISNTEAESLYDRLSEMFENNKKLISYFISIDDSGNLFSTQEGKLLSYLGKYFSKVEKNGTSLTDENLKNMCKSEAEYQRASDNIKSHIEKGYISYDETTGEYIIEPQIRDINRLLYQIYKEGGNINKENLKEVLIKNIPNAEAEKQFRYIKWRLDNLKEQGFLAGEKDIYYITEKGIEKRLDLLHPQRDLLRKELSYMQKLGLIESTAEGYKVTERYFKFIQGSSETKSSIFKKELAELIDRTYDNLDIGKIERNSQRILRGKFINNEIKDAKTSYEDIRKFLNVPDIISKTLSSLSTILSAAGVSIEETYNILHQWNNVSNSNIAAEKIKECIDKAFEKVNDDRIWGKTTILSTKEWNETFKAFGIEPPKWMYKSIEWSNSSFYANNLISLIHNLWKGAWFELQRQQMQQQAQAEMANKIQIKQMAIKQNKSALKEEIRKLKDRGSLSMDEELFM